jgi:uncharacterized membrane protein
VLSTIATSAMTVLGVTLTITLAVFALTAQGYSPRALRRFLRDRLVQAVIAGFVATFVFALAALRLVRTDEVPGVTVNVAAALAAVSIGLLIAFFHHMASEIRVERLIESIWAEAREAIPRAFPEPSGDQRLEAPSAGASGVTRARTAGRVRHADTEALAHVARATGGTVVLLRPPGDFVTEGEPLAEVRGGGAPTQQALDALGGAFSVGTQRTVGQDVAFGLRQLTDIGLRALSPGVNDPTTAHEAILRAADLLRRLADRRLGLLVEDGGRALVVCERPTWDELVGVALDQYAAVVESQADAATMLTMLDAIGRVRSATHDPERIESLRARARRVAAAADRALPDRTTAEEVRAAAAAVG